MMWHKTINYVYGLRKKAQTKNQRFDQRINSKRNTNNNQFYPIKKINTEPTPHPDDTTKLSQKILNIACPDTSFIPQYSNFIDEEYDIYETQDLLVIPSKPSDTIHENEIASTDKESLKLISSD